MTTITIAMDDETYRLCSLRAAAADKTVADLISDHLTGLVGRRVSEADGARLRQQMYDVIARIDARRQAEGEELPEWDDLTREELHDRDALR